MEEILASIRRIIEDSDTTAETEAHAQAAAEPAMNPADAPAGQEDDTAAAEAQQTGAEAAGEAAEAAAAGEDTAPEAVYDPAETPVEDAAAEAGEAEIENAAGDAEVEAFRQELSDDTGSEPADQSMGALNLTDIGDEVARQAEPAPADEEDGDDAVAGDGPAAEAAGDETVAQATEEDVAADAGKEETIASALGDEWRAVAAGHDDGEKAAPEPEERPDLAAASAAASETDAALAALAKSIASEAMNMERTEPQARTTMPAAADTGSAARPPILSEQAGRQVAAAFDELSEAFSGTRRKSFDEMAEEMLRPMLQDWLDNNLPVLVERLVREEIDRVARGGSR